MNHILRSLLFALTVLTFVPAAHAQEAALPARPRYMRYYCEADGGYLAGTELRGMFHLKNGLAFGEHISASLGTGLETYLPGRFVPVLLEARYKILDRKTSPFVSVSGGYLHGLRQSQVNIYYLPAYEQRPGNGYTLGCKAGIQHTFAPGLSIVTSLGWRFACTRQETYVFYYPYQPAEMSYEMHRFELSVGLIFK